MGFASAASDSMPTFEHFPMREKSITTATKEEDYCAELEEVGSGEEVFFLQLCFEFAALVQTSSYLGDSDSELGQQQQY